jgi:hypothetical protein
MTLQEANKITQLYGRYMEHVNGKMMRLFFAKIPQSLLPYPKDVILEACNVMAQYYFNQKNVQAENTFKEVAANLIMYVDDETALTDASKRFGNPEFRKIIIESLKKTDLTEIQEKGL